MKIPVYSSTIRRKEMDAVLTCMVAEKIGPGEMNERLVQFICESFPVEGALALRSTSIALQYALEALDLPKGSGIIISALAPDWHFYVTKKLGYEPIIVDVDPETALISIPSIEEAIAKGGRLVLVHESLGYIPDMQKLLTYNIPVIEDISQSAGSILTEKKAGMFGVFSILGLEERDILTSGGGAVLIAPAKREAIVIKKMGEEAPKTDILPDINSALGYVQFREFDRNIALRKDISTIYIRSLLQGRHKTINQEGEGVSSCYSFPVILSSGFKEVKQYVGRKEIEIELAFCGSVADRLGDTLEGCINAKSLLMRCVLFPLYPRLGASNTAKVAKVLATLP
jgi:dTDP-4-amino-4,6-dideoxygalactose transaminase